MCLYKLGNLVSGLRDALEEIIAIRGAELVYTMGVVELGLKKEPVIVIKADVPTA